MSTGHGIKGLRAVSARQTNLTLLLALVLAFATGIGAVATERPLGAGS